MFPCPKLLAIHHFGDHQLSQLVVRATAETRCIFIQQLGWHTCPPSVLLHVDWLSTILVKGLCAKDGKVSNIVCMYLCMVCMAPDGGELQTQRILTCVVVYPELVAVVMACFNSSLQIACAVVIISTLSFFERLWSLLSILCTVERMWSWFQYFAHLKGCGHCFQYFAHLMGCCHDFNTLHI